MSSFEIILLLLGCLLASSAFAQVLPRVSLPLVQIALGAAVGCLITTDPTQIFRDPELFLVLFIAPLLFEESRHADKAELLRAWAPVASLAIGLVIVTTLVAGAALHLAEPAIPLAAAFALGAALGPTDAAAVAALGADVTLTKRQKSLLSGEALFNDASGVVCFEFAVAAAATGSFSLARASATFLADFFGGIAVGLAGALVITLLVGRIRALGLETPTEHVLFEVCTPFVTFLAAEALHTSGILAVVAAGLLMRFNPGRLTAESSRHALASESVWELLTFIINGTVFVLLGMKLPSTIAPTLRVAQGTDFARLCGLVLLACVLVVGVRLLWVLALERIHRARHAHDGQPHNWQRLLRSALVTTLSGPKGAVTLSIMLTLPYLTAEGTAFPQRSLLIFVASGVIVLTLVLANFLVPLLVPAPDTTQAEAALTRARAEILRRTIAYIEQGKASHDTSRETAAATRLAARSFRERLDATLEREASPATMIELRLRVIEAQIAFVHEQIDAGSADRNVAERYLEALEGLQSTYELHRGVSGGRGRRRAHAARLVRAMASRADDAEREQLASLHAATERHAIDQLRAWAPELSDEQQLAARIIAGEHRAQLAATANVRSGSSRAEWRARVQAQCREIEAEALAFELEQIRELHEAGELSRVGARELREEVYLLQMGLDAR